MKNGKDERAGGAACADYSYSLSLPPVDKKKASVSLGKRMSILP
jgi:hypothetical protein